MQIVKDNAEEKILREVEKVKRLRLSSRCIYLRLSDLKEEERAGIELQTRDALLTRSLEDDGRIYQCKDGDLFIFARLATWKKVDFLATHLASNLSPARIRGLADLFEVTVDAEKIMRLCHEKIRVNTERAEQEEYDRLVETQRERIRKIREMLNAPATPELRAYIARQREKRGKTTLMVADDDAFSRRMVGNALKDSFDMHLTEDGESTLLSYVECAPDILFLDIEMPDINGHDVLKKIFDFDPGAYVVMFSGNGNRENVMKAVETGAKGFVGKPFSREKLLHYIEKCREFRRTAPTSSGKEPSAHGYA